MLGYVGLRRRGGVEGGGASCEGRDTDAGWLSPVPVPWNVGPDRTLEKMEGRELRQSAGVGAQPETERERQKGDGLREGGGKRKLEEEEREVTCRGWWGAGAVCVGAEGGAGAAVSSGAHGRRRLCCPPRLLPNCARARRVLVLRVVAECGAWS
eukprot:2927635-Rhodomonas_salina.1